MLTGGADDPVWSVLWRPSIDFQRFIHSAMCHQRQFGVNVRFVNATNPAEIDLAFSTIQQQGAHALFVSADPLFGSRIDQIVTEASKRRIPTMYYRKEFPKSGGLISYGTNQPNAYREAALYVTRILKGEKPADLPVLLSNEFELVINFGAAKRLGLTIPTSLLARADEVIE